MVGWALLGMMALQLYFLIWFPHRIRRVVVVVIPSLHFVASPWSGRMSRMVDMLAGVHLNF